MSQTTTAPNPAVKPKKKKSVMWTMRKGNKPIKMGGVPNTAVRIDPKTGERKIL